MSIKNIIIFHFYPIEGYPPIQNLLNYLESRNIHNVICFTTRGRHSFKCKYKNIKLIRLGKSEPGTKINLIISYLLFHLGATLYSLIKSPKSILYYESISSFPALVVKSIIKKTKLLIHYHEYTSPGEYNGGPYLPSLLHKFEKTLYHKAHWISHTNSDRLKFFREDNKLKENTNLHVIPNYPPRSWHSAAQTKNSDPGKRIKLVYVGYSLSDKSMYASEIIRWAVNHKEQIILDFYLMQTPSEFKTLATKKKADNINFFPAISYDNLPTVLSGYQIGLILYKGNTPNYNYNAPNKLFEYLACGLDVWFPDVLQGPKPYIKENSYPKVISVNFENLEKFNWQEAAGHEELEYKATNYFCEDVYGELVDFMKG